MDYGVIFECVWIGVVGCVIGVGCKNVFWNCFIEVKLGCELGFVCYKDFYVNVWDVWIVLIGKNGFECYKVIFIGDLCIL